MIRVSVIIPTYNRAATLPKTIQSALAQGEEDIEILVCDDGSTDQSAELVTELNDPRIKWIPGPHTGLSACPVIVVWTPHGESGSRSWTVMISGCRTSSTDNFNGWLDWPERFCDECLANQFSGEGKWAVDGFSPEDNHV